jgi:glutamyl-tRNA synthetase
VRTALYNYLFARQNGGKMILRIEDTDSQRFVPGAEAYINEALAWLGIGIDEGVNEGGPYGPYKQSERRDIYRAHVKTLLDNGRAYIAFDTPQELESRRAQVPNFQYDASTRGTMRNSLTLPADEVERLIAAGEKYVVRFKVEPGRQVTVPDLLRGDVVISSDVLDDKVLYKSADDLPTYHLANIVDDHLMKITHVIRGEEWLPSAPLHVLLYEAFGWADTAPRFVHLPLLLKPDGKGKLSKRDGDRLGFPVFPLEWHDPKSGEVSSGYRERGYLPKAVVNFLALLGWNPGDDTEIMTIDELISKFSFDHCSRSGAKFDFEKGKWFNHKYLQALPDSDLARRFTAVLAQNNVDASAFTVDYVTRAVAMVKSRANFVGDLWEQARFFFKAPETYDPKAVKKRWSAETPAILRALLEQLRALPSLASEPAEAAILAWIEAGGYHLGNVMNALRLAVVGECKGPHMFDIIELMGLDETAARVERAIATIELPQ